MLILLSKYNHAKLENELNNKFLIRENKSGNILFLGRAIEPKE